VDGGRELPPVAVGAGHDEPEGGVPAAVEDASHGARRQPARPAEPRIVVQRPHPRVQEDEALEALGPIQGERQGDWPPVVVHDQREAVEPEVLDEGGEHRGVRRGRVSESGRPVREPEPEQVRRDAAPAAGRAPDQVPPLVRPRRRPVDEEDRLTRSLVDVVEAPRAQLDESARKRIAGAIHPGRHRVPW
jgi:hypothetical protein